ncbi:uncharacterized protein LTR77_006656 [Saxophila tyrrhenica]|uniref:Uncharacterized protein n=1 Tax=Saxophila tyrrhenica TaxID=1690608 RepID=A0AAV9P8D5_9PEZI|nr:hypothetical protein LTR77_006656 [Saxophila tyrrhenica]
MDPAAAQQMNLLTQQAQHQPPPDTAPPPYDGPDSDSDSDAGDDDEEDDSTPPPSSPLKLTINAAHQIQGNNNLVPTSPSALSDATKFSAILLHTVNALNKAAGVENGRRRRALKLDLTINCGVTVVGHRNVVGSVGLKPKPAMAVAGTGNAVAGAKRKAEKDDQAVEREAKRVDVGDESK